MAQVRTTGTRTSSNGTSTSTFGSSRREAHDASAFYERFDAPLLSDDATVNRGPEADRALAALAANPCVHSDACDMREVPDGSVALVVTSPPYFVGKEYELAVAGDDSIRYSYADYLSMLTSVFAECVNKLEAGGRIAVNVANLGRRPYRSLSADVIAILEGLGLLLRGEIIWKKGKGANGSCAWGSFASAANPTLRDTSERVIVASKGRFDRALSPAERQRRGMPHENTITADEFMEATIDTWEIPPESATRVSHPAPFPVELPRRLIELFTYVDDLVLDPFMGSGTTLMAAEQTGRRGIGYDTHAGYVEVAEQRLARARAEARTTSDDASVVANGASAVRAAAALLSDCGFALEARNARLRGGGVAFTFAASDAAGGRWWVEVAGSYASTKSGLARGETAYSVVAKAAVLASRRPDDRLLVLTAGAPSHTGSASAMLRSLGPAAVFDVIGLGDQAGRERLAAYAAGATQPLAGYWTSKQLAQLA